MDGYTKKKNPFQPAVDGDTIPELPSTIIASNNGLDVDILVGNTTEEWNFFLRILGINSISEDIFKSLIIWDDPEKIKSVYRQDYPDGDLYVIFSAHFTDHFFRIPGLRIAESNVRKGKNKTYVYQMSWKTPELGACHVSDMPFTFHHLNEIRGIIGNDPPVVMADEMHKAWIDFVRDGDPGWPEYDLKERKVKNFDVVSSVVKDPFPNTRKYWEDLGY